ncbi:hypothetical protein [Oryzobacter telluris]|uniref:hypothetical protein n=1 Tax=Oryzobacter telluris TaxID=3149179 RepID=UPI00370D0BDC
MGSGGRGSRVLSGARTWAAGRSYREYGVGLVLVVLLGSGAFGGLDDSRDEPPATAPTGRSLAVEPFRVTVERVRAGTDLGVASVPKPVGRYLLVSLKVSVRDDVESSVPWQTLRDLVRLEGADGLVGPYHRDGDEVPARPAEVVPTQLLSGDDAEGMGDIAPGLTYPVVVLFQQVSSASVPDEVTVVLNRHQWRQSNVDEDFAWFDTTPAVRVTVPVTEFAPAPEPSS